MVNIIIWHTIYWKLGKYMLTTVFSVMMRLVR